MTSSDVWYVGDDFTHVSTHVDTVVAWSEFADGVSRHISLPSIIREQPLRYRDALLNFVRRLETSPHPTGDLVDSLRADDDLSYWWMTLVFAKRWGDLGVLPEAVKMLALADLLDERRPRLLVVGVSDERIMQSIVSTAQLLGIPHESQRTATPQHSRLSPLRAARILLSGFRFMPRKHQPPHDNVIVDYLFRLEPQSLSGGPFRSQYWAHLPEILTGGTLWLHRFTPHSAIPTRRRARQLLKRFNSSDLPSKHVLLDDIHGLRELGATFRRYRTIRRLGRQSTDIAERFRSERADLWPIFKHDWEESFRGSHAMSMAMLHTALESTIGLAHGAKRCLYIYENQPWEAALVHTWRKHQPAPLIAVPHSTIRFWDVRYFVSAGTLTDSRFGKPDVIAVNSLLARQELEHGGWPADRLCEVEALMYLYLNTPDSACGQGDEIVVLGELDHASTQRYLQFLTHARQKSATHHAVEFKAHPLVDATTFDLQPLNATASTDHVSVLLRRARVLITGASGSTVLEALSRGIPTICVLDPAELDLSTIREHPLLKVVGTAEEFESALQDMLLPTSAQATTDHSLFHVDADLMRWRRLLLEPNS